jgi:cytidine deaminase
MDKMKIEIVLDVCKDIQDLSEADQMLLQSARSITSIAYAPYSHFLVGAAAVLNNGEMIKGTNQENASYPVGICAERALLATAANIYPDEPIVTMAIAYHNLNGFSNKAVSPCGMCRQALAEFENRTSQHIRLLLSGMEGEVLIVEKSSDLLPLSFGKKDLHNKL